MMIQNHQISTNQPNYGTVPLFIRPQQKPAQTAQQLNIREKTGPRLTCDNFLSKSVCKLLSCAVIWDSKSCKRVATFLVGTKSGSFRSRGSLGHSPKLIM